MVIVYRRFVRTYWLWKPLLPLDRLRVHSWTATTDPPSAAASGRAWVSSSELASSSTLWSLVAANS